MRNIFKLIASTIIVFALVVPSTAQGLHRFYLDYAVVQHSLKNDVGNFNEFMKLAELDRDSADFIAKFWWGKAKKECDEFIRGIIVDHVKNLTKETSNEEKEKLEKTIMEEADHCFYGVYYDHWDEINQMVVQKYKAALAGKDK